MKKFENSPFGLAGSLPYRKMGYVNEAGRALPRIGSFAYPIFLYGRDPFSPAAQLLEFFKCAILFRKVKGGDTKSLRAPLFFVNVVL